MTLPSGQISMYQVAVELGIGAGGLNLNDSRVRSLAGVPSGSISMSSLRGKTNYYAYISGISWIDYYPQGTSGCNMYVATNNGPMTSIAFSNMSSWGRTAYIPPNYLVGLQAQIMDSGTRIYLNVFTGSWAATYDVQVYVTFANGNAAYFNTGSRTWAGQDESNG